MNFATNSRPAQHAPDPSTVSGQAAGDCPEGVRQSQAVSTLAFFPMRAFENIKSAGLKPGAFLFIAVYSVCALQTLRLTR